MKVADVTVFRYDLPLVCPLELRGRRIETRSGLVLRIRDKDGATGYGDVAPLPGFSEERLADVADTAMRFARSLTGCEIPPELATATDGFERWLGAHNLAPSLQFGVETAILNLVADGVGVGLSRLLAPGSPRYLPVNGLLDGPRDLVLEQAQTLRRQGYRTLKLKVGRRASNGAAVPAQDDAETVRELRDRLGPGPAIRLDANRAWDYDTALEFGRALANCGIEYIEEPLRDPSRLVDFAGRSGLPVALDETVAEFGFDALERWRGAKALILKPTLLGGVEATMWFARRAANLNMTPVITSSFESGLGLTALAALAAALVDKERAPRVASNNTVHGAPPFETAAGLDTHRWLGADVLDGPVPIADGRIDLEQADALSRTVRTGTLREVRHE
jgi:O-succinylbenzoate synthase